MLSYVAGPWRCLRHRLGTLRDIQPTGNVLKHDFAVKPDENASALLEAAASPVCVSVCLMIHFTLSLEHNILKWSYVQAIVTLCISRDSICLC